MTWEWGGTVVKVDVYTYDASGNMLTSRLNSGSDGSAGCASTWTYDEYGNMLTVNSDCPENWETPHYFESCSWECP